MENTGNTKDQKASQESPPRSFILVLPQRRPVEGGGAPQGWVYCPPTKGRGHGRVLPPSAFFLMTSQTTRSAIYKGDTRGPDTEAPP